MMKKFIKFIKNDTFVFLSILSLLIGLVLLIIGISLEYPLMNLEQQYQIAEFGFYDSNKTYLLDVKTTLLSYSCIVALGISFIFSSFVSIIFAFFDSLKKGKKHEKENN